MVVFLYPIILSSFSILVFWASASPQLTLTTGSSFSVEDYQHTFLASPNSTFSCGFYPVGANGFTFSIWFTGTADKTVVWSANRHSPVNGHGSKVSLHDDGYLVLTDVNGSTVWTSTVSAGGGSTAELLESGNLVRSRRHSLVAKLHFANGYLAPCAAIDQRHKNGIKVKNNSRLAALDDKGGFFSSDALTVQASDFGLGIKRRLTLDYDGNLRIYSINTSDGSWIVTWQAIVEMHYVHGMCGKNGFCEYTPEPRCSCPPGFQMVDPQNWNKGCKPTFSYNCGKERNEYKFIEIPKTDFYDFDLSLNESISFEECRNICLDMCSCIAFSYRLTGTGVCYTKALLFNGYKSPAFPGSLYLKVPSRANIQPLSNQSGLTCSALGSQVIAIPSDHTRWLYFYIFPGAFGALELVLILTTWWFLSRKNDIQNSAEGGYMMIRNQFRRFTYQELKEATGKFREELGRGSSGIVYRGVLKDKRVIAVKKLIDVTRGEVEFQAEMSVIGKINHMNLVRIWGFCSEGKHKLLVYEYVENESLDRYLFNTMGTQRLLLWRERFNIALGAAKALAYLHHECLEWVFHCDVKPENILLTRDFEAKIADFGLSKLYKREGSSFNFSQMRGTVGYMAPEWTTNLPINAKVDVYSYGVVLLEIVAGQKISSCTTREGKVINLKQFVENVKKSLATGDTRRVVDVRLHGQFNSEQAMVMLTVAVSCLEEERSKRPTMDEVVKTLLDCEDRLGTLPVPSISAARLLLLLLRHHLPHEPPLRCALRLRRRRSRGSQIQSRPATTIGQVRLDAAYLPFLGEQLGNFSVGYIVSSDASNMGGKKNQRLNGEENGDASISKTMAGLGIVCLAAVQLSLACLLLCSSPSTAQRDTLGTGSSLSVEDHAQPFLVSPDGTFSCGFIQAGDDGENAFSFSVWFTNAKDSAVVWTANRDSPVNGRGSRITFRRDGELVLTDTNGTTVWASRTGGGGRGLTVSLLDTGNLVITDPSTNGGRTMWQSFDWPTDTLLPSQRFTKDTKLVAGGGGYFSLYFDNDNVLRMLYDGPDIASIYWPLPGGSVFDGGRTNYNSTRVAVLDDGVFRSSDRLQAQASDTGVAGIKRRLTIEQDGNLRMYSLNASTRGWAVTWTAVKQPCQAHGLCGRNGICEYLPSLRCSCPPGYVMNDRRDWNKGCKPTFAVGNCSRGAPPPEKFKSVVVPQTDFYGYDLMFNQSMTFNVCRQQCLDDCQCVAFSYRFDGVGRCYTKGMLFNGYRSANFPGNIYLKVPLDFNESLPSVTAESAVGLVCDPNVTVVTVSADVYGITPRSTGKWTYLFVFAGVLGVVDLLFIATGWWFLSSKQSIPSSLEAGYKMLMTSQFRRFTYRELRNATGNFKEELGRGGSGVVYRGVLDGGKVVAVKRLEAVDVTKQGDEEFWAEMTVLGRINHINLVRIWGFCSERKHKMLVYEYVDNQSLDRHLFDATDGGKTTTTTLAWRDRYKIALGTARGLAYLHHECLEWVIHCDVKPENILLTREFDAKIADFGLAKLSKRDGTGVELTHMRGTSGYMAPEWALNLPINAKVDVYSFGIVLLEIVVGSRVADQRNEAGERLQLPQITQALRHVLDSGDVVSLVDARLQGQFNPRQAVEMVRISLACMEERSSRPTMDDIAKSLTAFDDEDEHPAYH
uniref:non-specific serine/threonine protein kinase n=1 Tax=Leersia perrieri TaxID=77586 RepID=A0A0D9V3Y7_9ORYZ